MGCIEIMIKHYLKWHGWGLIETWDVLKSVNRIDVLSKAFLINKNMGCIEIPLSVIMPMTYQD